MNDTQKQQLKDLMNEITKNTFVTGYNATEEEKLGMILSKFYEWDGIKILQTAYWALEDSNFHSENEVIQTLIDKNTKIYPKLGK